jgi:hypothetical protein
MVFRAQSVCSRWSSLGMQKEWNVRVQVDFVRSLTIHPSYPSQLSIIIIISISITIFVAAGAGANLYRSNFSQRRGEPAVMSSILVSRPAHNLIRAGKALPIDIPISSRTVGYEGGRDPERVDVGGVVGVDHGGLWGRGRQRGSQRFRSGHPDLGSRIVGEPVVTDPGVVDEDGGGRVESLFDLEDGLGEGDEEVSRLEVVQVVHHDLVRGSRFDIEVDMTSTAFT